MDSQVICYKYCGIGHEKLKVYEERPFIYEIYGKDYYTNNYTYNIII